MSTPTDDLAAVRLLQLVSPALPIGAFAYSRGLESAVELGWAHDAASAGEWISGLMRDVQARLEVPVLLRVHRAIVQGDAIAARRWALWLEATRESSELRAESRSLGASLARLLEDLGIAEGIDPAIRGSHTACFALACARSGIDERACARGYLYAWLEGQVSAAIKLVPLGQTDGQRLLYAASAHIDALVTAANEIEDDDVGAIAPGLAIASALHETQHTRLFRS
jgi:urease accessory protein